MRLNLKLVFENKKFKLDIIMTLLKKTILDLALHLWSIKNNVYITKYLNKINNNLCNQNTVSINPKKINLTIHFV